MVIGRARSPVERLDEEVDRAAAGEADGEGLVVAVAERDEAGRAGGEDVQRFGDDGTLDTAAADRAGDLAGVADGHRRPRFTRSGALDVDHPRECDLVPRGSPTIDVVEDVTH